MKNSDVHLLKTVGGRRASGTKLPQDVVILAVRRGRTVDILCAAAVAMLGTVNLWKVSTIQDLVPLDLTLFAVVATAVCAAAALVVRGLRVERQWVVLIVGFILFVPAALLASDANPYSSYKVNVIFTVTLLATAGPMILLTTARRRARFLLVLTGLGLCLSVWLIVGGVATSEGRVEIDGANPISLSRVACMSFVTLGIFALRNRGVRRLLPLVGMSLSVVAAVSTGSRGPLASAVGAVVLVALLTSRSRSRIKVAAGLLVLGVAAWQAITQFTPTTSLERLGQAGLGDSARARLLAESANIALSHPQGVGWGRFGDYLSPSARIDAQGYRQYPHNIIAEVAVEAGILGLAGLLLLLVVSWRRLRSAAETTAGQAMLGLWVLAVGSAMTSSDVVGNRTTWMMVGAGLALPAVTRLRRNGQPAQTEATVQIT